MFCARLEFFVQSGIYSYIISWVGVGNSIKKHISNTICQDFSVFGKMITQYTKRVLSCVVCLGSKSVSNRQNGAN